MSDERNPARKVKTDPFRMSFPYILEARKDEDTGKERHELAMLYPPGTDMTRYKAALTAAMVDTFGDDQAKWPRLKRGPKDVIKDFAEFNANAKSPLAGDWTGWTLIRCAAQVDKPPAVVGPVKGQDGKFPVITDKRETYGGRWARATIEAYYYPKQGSGVTFGLLNVQLLKHDTKFGKGVSDPNKDFDNASEEWTGEADFGEKPKAGADAGDEWN